MQKSRNHLSLALATILIFLPLIQRSAAQSLSPRDIAQRALPSVVALTIESTISGRISYGSGFFVSPDTVATNYHVIEGAVGGFAKVNGGKTQYQIEGFVGLDPERDLALVKLKGVSGTPLLLGNSSLLSVGDDIFAVGNPEGLEGTFSQGIVSSVRQSEGERLIQITAPISHGSSGGPVLNNQGRVVGVAVGSLVAGQALNFAIPSSALSTMLANKRPLISFSEALRNYGTTVASAAAESNEAPATRPSQSPRMFSEGGSSVRRNSISPRAGAITQLSLRFTNGKSAFYKPSDGRFSSSAQDRNRDGLPDYVVVEFHGQNVNWSLDFTTHGLDSNMEIGTYVNCQRAAFSEGTAGLEVHGNGSGCNTVRGKFTVYEVQFERRNGQLALVSFAASFEQDCMGISGTVYFNAPRINGVD
jgi:S1-C subfamily serine protease